MKNKNLNMLLKTSIFSNKSLSAIYCVFVLISTILILVTIGVILPLSTNITENVINHVSNREAIIEFDGQYNSDYITKAVDEIKGMEHIETVYRMPAQLNVVEQSEAINDNCKLGFIHTGSQVAITSGRAFDESETEVAIVPEIIKKYDVAENSFRDISGKSLLDKILILTDECNNSHKAKVVGVYSSVDPLYSGKQILIPQNDLSKYTDEFIENSSMASMSLSKVKSFIILADSVDNIEKIIENVEHFGKVYRQQSLIDGDTYTVALCVMIAILVFFIAMEIFGLFMLLKNNIDGRTKELALYRSLGYKSDQLFYIIFTNHFLLGVFSIISGILCTLILNAVFINPLIYELTGNTIMKMTVSISPVSVVSILVLFVIILLVVCRNAVKRSEKIDLTILLRH